MARHQEPNNRNHDPAGSPAATTSRPDKGRAKLDEGFARPIRTTWLSGKQAAAHLDVCWPTLRQLLLDHDIPHLRVGRLWRIDVAVLDEHLHRIANAR